MYLDPFNKWRSPVSVAVFVLALVMIAILAIGNAGCATLRAVVFRPPTVCEKLCDHYFYLGSTCLPLSEREVLCEYTDPFNRWRGTRTATLHCEPDCATAAAKLK
jgi:hypothetical protein